MATPETLYLYLPANTPEADRAHAVQIAGKWDITLSDEAPPGLALVVENCMLSLKDFAQPKQQGVSVDFLAGSVQYRRENGGGRKEPIAKAVGIKGEYTPSVIDATPGLGRDAFVLACLGCTVTMVERSWVVAALLDDGLNRLRAHDPHLATRFTLVHGNSIDVLTTWAQPDIDAIYLDPMFPHRKKSALVKKEMKVFQALLGDDPDADALLAPARKVAQKRVVVKRPNSAPYLADVPATMAITSKKHRFDVYLA